MTPEQLSRREIDRQLQCGLVGPRLPSDEHLGESRCCRGEFPLKSGHADYLLYVEGKVVGVVKAKPEGHTLTGVETQSAKYNEGLPANLPHYVLPLPFSYESTGSVTQFTNRLEPDARSREASPFIVLKDCWNWSTSMFKFGPCSS